MRKGPVSGPFRLFGPAQRSQVEVDDLGIVQQLATLSGVGVSALIQNVCPVGDLETAAGILLNHQDGNAAVGDEPHSLEHQVLIGR